MSKRNGTFITFEGCDGCGKSSQIRMLLEELTARGVDFVVTREPGGTAVGENVRAVILHDAQSVEPMTEALLFAAARVQHYREVIAPALEAGRLVVCDRYLDSSLAYQGSGRGLGQAFVRRVFDATLPEGLPDLTFFMDVSPEVAFLRKHGIDPTDRIEIAGMEFHMRVYNGYKEAIAREPQRFVVLDAEGTKFETQEIIRKILQERGIL
ncbi:MAG: dTMP kinase [Clostridiales bacterium]|jgi:dTMP kinase|nr:dTMP kinase [Clostridiales bacterium]